MAMRAARVSGVRFFSSVAPVAKSAAGKWVSRVGASGGGKAYKKTRPGNYYGVLAIIVILGLASVVFARYEYRHPSTSTSGPEPRIGTTWYSALAIDDCGTPLPYLNPDPTYKGGFTVLSNNVIKVSPVSAADAGDNATVSQFAAEFPGLIASSTELAVPTATGTSDAATTYHNGDSCGPKTKYAGQSGHIIYAYWRNFGQKEPSTTTNPSSIKFSQYLRVTMAFVPNGVTPNAPSQKTVNSMVLAATTTVTTTTTPVTTTTVGTTTTTTASTTTTKPKG